MVLKVAKQAMINIAKKTDCNVFTYFFYKGPPVHVGLAFCVRGWDWFYLKYGRFNVAFIVHRPLCTQHNLPNLPSKGASSEILFLFFWGG